MDVGQPCVTMTTTLLELFSRRVEAVPDVVAVWDQHAGCTLTYAELDRCARLTAGRIVAELDARERCEASNQGNGSGGGSTKQPKVGSIAQRLAAQAEAAAEGGVDAVREDAPVGVCGECMAFFVNCSRLLSTTTTHPPTLPPQPPPSQLTWPDLRLSTGIAYLHHTFIRTHACVRAFAPQAKVCTLSLGVSQPGISAVRSCRSILHILQHG